MKFSNRCVFTMLGKSSGSIRKNLIRFELRICSGIDYHFIRMSGSLVQTAYHPFIQSHFSVRNRHRNRLFVILYFSPLLIRAIFLLCVLDWSIGSPQFRIVQVRPLFYPDPPLHDRTLALGGNSSILPNPLLSPTPSAYGMVSFWTRTFLVRFRLARSA